MPIYSQLGQAEWIFGLLTSCGINRGLIIEVGAHTPHKFSNSRTFIERGWSALLVEGDQSYCSDWEEFISSLPSSDQNIILHKDYVELKEGGLDDIVTQYDVNYADVLFLDIDGGEWHLLKSLCEIKPSIVCVEADGGYPHSITYTPEKIESGNQASHRSMHEMMKQQGYQYLYGFAQDMIYASDEFIAEVIQPKMPHIDFGDDVFFSVGKNNLEPCIMAFNGWANLAIKKLPRPKVYDYASARIDRLVNSCQRRSAVELFHLWERALHSFAYLLDGNPEHIRHSFYLEVEEFILKYKTLSRSMGGD